MATQLVSIAPALAQRRQPSRAATAVPIARSAADTTIAPATLEVIQLYKPQVRLSPRPQLQPELPPPDTARPVVQYAVPPQSLSYEYRALPLRPLALARDTAPMQQENFVQLGGGNLSTLYLAAGFTGLKQDNFRKHLQLSHLSQKGKTDGQQSSVSSLQASVAWDGGANRWRTTATAMRNQYRYYGYDRIAFEYDADTLRQTFYGIRAGLQLSHPAGNSSAGWQYAPTVFAGYYGDRRGAGELSLWLDVPLEKQLNDHLKAEVGVNARLAHFANADTVFFNNTAGVYGGLVYRQDALALRARLMPLLGMGGHVRLLPDIAAAYTLGGDVAVITAGWQGSIRQNTYEELTTRNPFLQNSYSTRQTRSDEVYAQAVIAAGHHLSLEARGSWWNIQDIPLYVNKPYGDRKNFVLLYDDVQALALNIAARYQLGTSLSIGVQGIFTSYYHQKNYSRIYGEPSAVIRANAGWRPVPALLLTAYGAVLDGLYARNRESGATIKMPAVTDFGLGGDYQIIRQLGVFLQVNNLLGQANERWYGYPSYGFNIFGGARFNF